MLRESARALGTVTMVLHIDLDMIQSLGLFLLRHHCLWDPGYGEFMSSHFVSAYSIHKRLGVHCIYTLCYFIKA